MEERDTDTSTSEGDQNFSPGGPAGTTANDSKKTDGMVNRSSDAYDVIWYSVGRKYVHASTRVSAGVQGDGHVEGQHDVGGPGVQVCAGVLGDGHQQEQGPQHDVGGPGGQVCVQVRDSGHEEQGPHHDVLGDQVVHSEEGFENEDRKFEKSFSENLKSCAILDTKFEFEDYEGVIYRELCRKIDWS